MEAVAPFIKADPVQIFKSVAPKLVPFVKTVVVYFVAWIPYDAPSVFGALLKCLPIICLSLFVIMQGVTFKREHSYNRLILIGLIFSCIGDACLIWHESHFITGMVAFGIAHLAYLFAFGFSEPYNWWKGIPFICVYALTLHLLYDGLSGIMAIAVPVYMLLINLMAWRAYARIEILDNTWPWTKLCACIGVSLFMISDFCIGIDKFYSPVPASRIITMTTYYASQLFLSLSTFNNKELLADLTQKKLS